MQKFPVSAAVVAVLSAMPAMADDAPPQSGVSFHIGSSTQADAASQVQEWPGLYVGALLGGAWGSSGIGVMPNQTWWNNEFASDIPSANIFSNDGPDKLKSSGLTGGLQAGYNFQDGIVIYGVEGDASYLGLKGSKSRGTFTNDVNNESYTFNESLQTHSLITVRGRLGYLLEPNTLLFATAGLAMNNQGFSDRRTSATAIQAYDGSQSATKIRGTAGGGVETNVYDGWTARIESTLR